MSKGSWLFGFACGIAAGWLFAPEKGSDLRKKIFKARSQGKMGIAPIKRDVVEALKEVADSMKNAVNGSLNHSSHDAINDEMELVKKLVTSTGQKSAASKPRAIKPKRKAVTKKLKSKPKIQD